MIRDVFMQRLKTIMRMHPVGATLFKWKIVAEGFTGSDRILGHERNPIHRIWQDQPVPVNTGWNLELIYDFHMKSVHLLRRISLRAVNLFDCDDGNLCCPGL